MVGDHGWGPWLLTFYPCLGTGSHSATKLCRWTKSMLQGKGGCYKHTFYGIASHQCMEHTPNVSCANKCIFCWRNHINPVALDWKFDTDDPEEILEESLRKHYATIEKQCLSPNALEHRKAEARQVRHCALSLVGEPVAGSCFQTFYLLSLCFSTVPAHIHAILHPPTGCIYKYLQFIHLTSPQSS